MILLTTLVCIGGLASAVVALLLVRQLRLERAGLAEIQLRHAATHDRLQLLERQMVDLIATAQVELLRRRQSHIPEAVARERARRIAEEVVRDQPERAVEFVAGALVGDEKPKGEG